jgi:THAP domain
MPGDRGGISRLTGKRCVAANCGNTNADGYSMHFFPKDPKRRKIWTDFVQLTRADWHGPTEYSVLCSFHFTPDSLSFRHRFETEQMGLKPKKVLLNDDACPTIHSVGVGNPVLAAEHSTTVTVSTKLEMLSSSEDVTTQRSPPKKIRRTYQKREAARVII